MDKYKEEAISRWGNTEAYKEYESKTAGYTQRDFADSTEELKEIFSEFSLCKAQGEAPDSPKSQKLVRKLQSFITENFYTCTHEILRGLGMMYISDERFTENIDAYGAGTAEFVNEAIEIYTKD